MYIYWLYLEDGTHQSYYSFHAAMIAGCCALNNRLHPNNSFKIGRQLNNEEIDVFFSAEWKETK